MWNNNNNNFNNNNQWNNQHQGGGFGRPQFGNNPNQFGNNPNQFGNNFGNNNFGNPHQNQFGNFPPNSNPYQQFGGFPQNNQGHQNNAFAQMYSQSFPNSHQHNNPGFKEINKNDFYKGDQDSDGSDSDDIHDPINRKDKPQFENLDAEELNNIMNEDKEIDGDIDQIADALMFKTKQLQFTFEKKNTLTEKNEINDNQFDTFNEDNINNWVIQTFEPKQALDMKSFQNGTLNMNMNAWNQMNHAVAFVADSQEYNNIIQSLQYSGQQYTDEKFKPGFEAIYGFGETNHLPVSYIQKIEWKRPGEVFQGNYHIFEKDIQPNDIKQGILGDCYFLAAMAAVAENQNRIKKLFLSRETNNVGCYCVALCLNGVWENVIMDDYIPMRPDKPGSIAFNHTTNNELWAILLEKAWAKVHGGYLNIDGGLIREALRDLTGAPCITHFNQLETKEAHWQRILDAERNNWIMCAASSDIKKTGNDSRDNQTGLSGNHAYSLLAAYEIGGNGYQKYLVPRENSNPSNERIVKMRNPWGKGEWTGAWSDEDNRNWTPQMRQLLNHPDVDDGVFFMPFDDFLKYFHDYQLCYYNDNYRYSAQKYTTSKERPTLVEFNVSVYGEYYITVNQINTRFFKQSNSKLKN